MDKLNKFSGFLNSMKEAHGYHMQDTLDITLTRDRRNLVIGTAAGILAATAAFETVFAEELAAEKTGEVAASN